MISAQEFHDACDRYRAVNRLVYDIRSDIMSTEAQFGSGMRRLRAAGDAMRSTCSRAPIGAIGCHDITHDCVGVRRADR